MATTQSTPITADVEQSLHRFEHFLFLKGLQPVTVAGHLAGVKRIIRQIGADPTSEAVERFVVGLYRSPWSYYHKTNSVKSLEHWLDFLGRPVRFGRQHKPRTLLKGTLTEADVNRLLFVCRTVREQAILACLAYSGVRPKELVHLRLRDVHFGDRMLFVEQGKGFTDGLVPLASACLDVLLKYQHARDASPDDWLFTTYDGRQYNTSALRKLVKVLGRRGGFTRRIYPYLFRHTLATVMINRGAHILQVKRQLRHAWLDTTMRYIHSIANLESADRFLPSYL